MIDRAGGNARPLEPSRQSIAPAWLVAAIVLAALAFRLFPYAAPGVLVGVREYDDGVMFAGALHLAQGLAPYADFIYLHPPGSLLVLMPEAALASWTGEPLALAVARIVAVLIGAANALLIALLLRRRGWLATLVGAGAYAVWPVVVSTERTVLLEPMLNAALLVALLAVRRRSAAGSIVAGVALGAALTIKYWAVFDIVVVAVMIAVAIGVRALVAYLVSGTAVVVATLLPFFVRDPAAMWEQTVMVQLSRHPDELGVVGRAGILSLTSNIHRLDALVPTIFWTILAIGLLVAAAAPIVLALGARRAPRRWPDAAWWGVIAIIHVAVLATSGVFFYHYAVWALAPLCLCLGWVAGGVRRGVWTWIVAGALAAVVVLAGIGETRRIEPASSADGRLAAAAEGPCVWALPSMLVHLDAVRSNLRNGCAFDVDPIGVSMVLDHRRGDPSPTLEASLAWRERAHAQMDEADSVVLFKDAAATWFDEESWVRFVEQFVEVARDDRYVLWGRRGD